MYLGQGFENKLVWKREEGMPRGGKRGGNFLTSADATTDDDATAAAVAAREI